MSICIVLRIVQFAVTIFFTFNSLQFFTTMIMVTSLWIMTFTTAQKTEMGSLSGDIEINTSVEPGSDLEYEILQVFENNGFEEIDLDADEENEVRKKDRDLSYTYELRLSSLTHISSLFIIPPVMILLDGTNVMLCKGSLHPSASIKLKLYIPFQYCLS